MLILPRLPHGLLHVEHIVVLLQIRLALLEDVCVHRRGQRSRTVPVRSRQMVGSRAYWGGGWGHRTLHVWTVSGGATLQSRLL